MRTGRPVVVGRGVTVKAEIAPEVAAAVDTLVRLSGTSRATFLREALYAGLAAKYDIIPAELASDLTPTHYKTRN